MYSVRCIDSPHHEMGYDLWCEANIKGAFETIVQMEDSMDAFFEDEGDAHRFAKQWDGSYDENGVEYVFIASVGKEYIGGEIIGLEEVLAVSNRSLNK